MLDWEENIFLGLKAVYHRVRVRPAQRRREAVRATLKERRGRLLLLGQMIAGSPLSLFETDNLTLCTGNRLFLPREFAAASSPEHNAAFYDVKAIIGALAVRGQWHRERIALAERVAACASEFPGLGYLVSSLAADLPRGLWAELGEPQAGDDASTIPGSEVLLDAPRSSESDQKVTEIEGKGQSAVEVTLAPDGDGPGAETPIHTFEKAETLEEANGLSRKTDDDDELEEHAEALESLDMRHVQRSVERPRSIYRSDLILDGLTLEVKDAGPGTGLPYPEWDFKRRDYRHDWCHVQPERVADGDPAWARLMEQRHRGLIQRLKRQFAAVVSDWQRMRRQPAGAEFDLDAVIDAEVERRTGHTPPEAIYVDRHRDLHDIAAVILLDQSYSTDAWLENARVLDTITSTLFCAGEVLTDSIASFAVASFSSNTRRSCRFATLKDFHEPWRKARSRLGAIEPCGYTRIGPALRHAQELLERQSAQRKIVILITDGRPCDYDRYEGAYGLHDVKKAIETGALHGIATHAFAIEKRASECFPQMFSRRGFDIMPRPEHLTGALCQLFARMIAS
ncbi:nitric oxide reductase activation protein NorD [Horticoccus sp. 23ND18S-11]|uniref:nitric oxide reductase activation protein NorD n=1 Tax=Horticoccus sp. 23ND18S-11 TaxID=3391832 RepID=UPI0039C8C569